MNVRLFAAAAAALLTVACGSEKKSTPPGVPTVSYTGPVAPASFSSASTDRAAVAGAAVAAGGMLGGMSSAAVVFGAARPPAPMGVKDVLAAAADAFHRPEVASAAGVLATSTVPCPNGGSSTLSVSHQSADPAVTTAGDWVEVSYAGCTVTGDLGGSAVTNGSFRLTIDQTTGDDFVATPSSITTDRAFGLTIAFDNLVTVLPEDGLWAGTDGDLGVSFVATVADGTITYGISGTEFVQAAGMAGQVMAGLRLAPLQGQARYHDTAVETFTSLGTVNATHVSSSWDLDARLCTTEMGGCANIQTNPVFLIVDPNPYPNAGGALTVSDDGGRWVKVTAMDPSTGACRITWSFDGSVLDTFWDSL